MRPCRIGTSSGTRDVACDNSRAIGSRDRLGPTSACDSSGVNARAALPRATRSARLRCSVLSARATRGRPLAARRFLGDAFVTAVMTIPPNRNAVRVIRRSPSRGPLRSCVDETETDRPNRVKHDAGRDRVGSPYPGDVSAHRRSTAAATSVSTIWARSSRSRPLAFEVVLNVAGGMSREAIGLTRSRQAPWVGRSPRDRRSAARRIAQSPRYAGGPIGAHRNHR